MKYFRVYDCLVIFIIGNTFCTTEMNPCYLILLEFKMFFLQRWTLRNEDELYRQQQTKTRSSQPANIYGSDQLNILFLLSIENTIPLSQVILLKYKAF